MSRQKYFNFIEEKLSILATRIEIRGGLNILDLNLHSENFYLHFLNLLFGWDLINCNKVQHNMAGIDLVDTRNNIVAQVSSTATRQKIESALSKDLSEANICLSSQSNLLELSENDKTQGTRISKTIMTAQI